jgi:hypothetical protein
MPPSTPMDKWEYGVERLNVSGEIAIRDAEKQLNDSGREGWELVSVVPSTGGYLLFFKRPVK